MRIFYSHFNCIKYLILFLSFPIFSSKAQNVHSENDKLRVYFDCQTDCDLNYIRTEINYVDHVNDRFAATVYILATSQRTGSGGRIYMLQITGQEQFSGMNDTLSYTRNATATDDEVRKLNVETLKLGLLPFILKTKMAKDLIFSFRKDLKQTLEKPKKDAWNLWVFNLNVGGNFSGDKNYSETRFNSGISAGRVTEKLKTNFYLNGNHSKNRYGEGINEFKYTNKHYSLQNTTVWSLDKHLSAGGDIYAERSDYRNYRLNTIAALAIEYNFYPYSESTNHYAGLMYRAGPAYYNYTEETIYSKMKELRFQQSLAFNISYNQKWGEVSGSAFFSHYFHDLSKNRLSFSGNAQIRLFKGLSVNFYGYYAFQRDQLSIVKGDVTNEDLLTRRRQLNSSYDFYTNFGLRYRFGSLFNNVVNPRFNR